ncbi:MAG: aminotransferase class I/II-fold pyridoxal phosphate-dependent enzyme [Candidatus Omnitrophica bacterium]|nr:aminotransferase class I/II-fold pyridoxal phosphate-dependent enzyme [Candidatus Omnitrophota bacterium]
MINKICRGTINFTSPMMINFLGNLAISRKAGNGLILDFQNQFADYINIDHAIAVSCAKTALSLALQALGAKADDQIIVPSYTVTEVIDVIIAQGLKPVFIDISLCDGNMIPELIEQEITKSTKFILMTHMHGNPCDIDSIIMLADKHGIAVIEDAAQACGAEYKDKKIGCFGKIAYFSFNMFKNINTLGGSMLVTNDLKLADEIKKISSHFKPISKIELMKRFFKAMILASVTKPPIFPLLVYPVLKLMGVQKHKSIDKKLKVKLLSRSKLKKIDRLFSPAQAGLGLLQLKKLDKLNQDKINNALVLNEKLSTVKDIVICKSQTGIKCIYLNYVIMVKNRQGLIDFLFDKGIDISPGFVQACAYIREFEPFAADCPNSLALEQGNLYLPIYHPLNSKHMIKIAALIGKYYEPKTRT